MAEFKTLKEAIEAYDKLEAEKISLAKSLAAAEKKATAFESLQKDYNKIEDEKHQTS